MPHRQQLPDQRGQKEREQRLEREKLPAHLIQIPVQLSPHRMSSPRGSTVSTASHREKGRERERSNSHRRKQKRAPEDKHAHSLTHTERERERDREREREQGNGKEREDLLQHFHDSGMDC